MTRRIPALCCLFWLATTGVADVTVYRSVDANGNVVFTDKPPVNSPSLPITVESDTPTPSPEVVERQEAMRALTDEIHADRLEREQARAEADAAAAQAAAGEPMEPYDDASTAAYTGPEWLPIYYPYPVPRPPWRPPHVPSQPAPVPRPNPNSDSPRGLLERIRQTY